MDVFSLAAGILDTSILEGESIRLS
jgi:hypothetical protein